MADTVEGQNVDKANKAADTPAAHTIKYARPGRNCSYRRAEIPKPSTKHKLVLHIPGAESMPQYPFLTRSRLRPYVLKQCHKRKNNASRKRQYFSLALGKKSATN